MKHQFEDIYQPGLRELKKAVSKTDIHFPGPKKTRRNVIAGLTLAIAEIPDGMANALLVGVSPVYGLYANMIGPFIGGIFSSTQMMTIVTTSAASLTVSQSIMPLPMEARADALFITVVLSGIIQILFALHGAARFIRFVSYSVMTGLLAGIGCLLVLSQLPTVTGISATGKNKVFQTMNLITDFEALSYSTLALATLTFILAIMLPRTRIKSFGTVISILIPSIIATLLNLEDVQVVQDFASIPSGIPLPHLPSLSDAFKAIPAALALSIVILVQGAGVGQGVPNPDGSRSRLSRDFIAQGAANIASGIFKGLPVGGSFSATTLNVVAGGSSRLATIFSGIWIFVIVLILSKFMAAIVMPSLGALLILVGLRSVVNSEYLSIWEAGWPSRLEFLLTFLATLIGPIEVAVGLGVLLSVVFYVIHSASVVSVVELVQLPDGRTEEREPPKKLPDLRVIVLELHGSLFFGGARTVEYRLPNPSGSKSPAVVLSLRNHTTIGATLIEVLSNYERKLDEVNGRLYISGVSHHLVEQLRNSEKLQLRGPVKIYEKEPILRESTLKAYEEAENWLMSLSPKKVE